VLRRHRSNEIPQWSGLLQRLELTCEPRSSRNILTFIGANNLLGAAGALRRAGRALDFANRLYRAYGAVADAIAGDGARSRRALRGLSTQAVV
jgi:hypothetical protein